MRVIVGLGNPGAAYAGTRHNVGQQVVSHAAAAWAVPLRRDGIMQQGMGRIHDHPVALVLPLTWMNVSGEAVAAFVAAHEVRTQDVVVVHDDLDLPAGVLRLRSGGGPGGHRGVESVVAALGTDAFARLKIGIGRPAPGLDPADFVLAPLTPAEQEAFRPVVTRAVEGLASVVRDGVAHAMNHVNRREPA